MRYYSLGLFLFSVVGIWALPVITPNDGMSASARVIYDQIDNASKVSFDKDTRWANFVTTYGEDHLTSGIAKIVRDSYLDQRTKDKIRTDFAKYLSAPAGEHSVTDAYELYLLKHLVNAYDLTLA